jgi:hypothetical protein
MILRQAQAPGQCELVSVTTELSSISQHIESVAALTCIQDQDATIAKVVEEFEKHAFAHLASRGIPDPKSPFESGFALGDGAVQGRKQHAMRAAERPFCIYLLVLRPLATRRVRARSPILPQPCSSPDSDWHDVGCGRWARERDHVQVSSIYVGRVWSSGSRPCGAGVARE